MRRIFLSAGHSNTKGQDNGAIGYFTEGVEAVVLRDMVSSILTSYYGIKPIVDNNNSVTGATVRLFKTLVGKQDIVVDIHFNAGPPSASGTEVFVPDKASEFELSLAEELSFKIASTLKIANRGVKPESCSARKKLLWMTIPAENILIEVCFVTSKTDVEQYLKHRAEVARQIAVALGTKLK